MARAAFHKLDRESRLRLVGFLCSFAWADLVIRDAEKAFVERLLGELGLEPEEKLVAEQWLVLPPRPEEVDPMDIPPEHRHVFLRACLDLVQVDGQIASVEGEMLGILENLLRGEPDDEVAH